jgi:hypothetical protein
MCSPGQVYVVLLLNNTRKQESRKVVINRFHFIVSSLERFRVGAVIWVLWYRIECKCTWRAV